MNLKEKTVLIKDNGLFIELALRLAKDFGRVQYYCEWKNAFPRSTMAIIGSGLPGVERVQNFWDNVSGADLIVFPDVYDADIQAELIRQGKTVWGCGGAEWLELDRWRTREWQKEERMPIPETERIVGIDKLREYLKTHENKWVKISTYRGDFETYHHLKYNTTMMWLDEKEHSLGARKLVTEFIVEENLDGIEIGYDGWTVDGDFPELGAYGFEIKDLGYAGRVVHNSTLPQPLKYINEKLSPVFKEARCRGFFSTEVRIGENRKPYLTDPCMRMGSPPSEGYMDLWSNLSDIIYQGAQGKLVRPQAIAKYFVIAMLHSRFADKNWMPVDFPTRYRDNIKLRNLTVLKNTYYAVPQAVGLPEIGAITGFGGTLEEAMKAVEKISKTVTGYDLEIHLESFQQAEDTIEEARKLGVPF